MSGSGELTDLLKLCYFIILPLLLISTAQVSANVQNKIVYNLDCYKNKNTLTHLLQYPLFLLVLGSLR